VTKLPRRLALLVTAAALPAAGQPAPTVSTDVDDLMRRAALPARPISATWRIRPLATNSSRFPGPTDTMLEAVLAFGFDDTAALSARAREPARWSDVSEAAWWPPGLRAVSRGGIIRVRVLPDQGIVRPPYADATLAHVPGTALFLLWLTTR
jgi:hypothetical protein